MHLVRVTGTPSYLKVCVTFLSHVVSVLSGLKRNSMRQSSLTQVQAAGRQGFQSFSPIVSSTTDYMQYIFVENDERICEKGKEERKGNVRKG